MNSKTKTILAASLFTVAAIILALVSGWQYFEHRVPEIKAKEPAALNIPEESVSETVTADIPGFTVKGTAKGASSTSSSSDSSSTSAAVSETKKYRTNYDMSVRKSPDYDAEKTGRKESGKEITIVETEKGARGSIWGQMPDGNWICLSDNEYQYASEI